VAKIEYSRDAVEDLDRLVRFLLQTHPEHASETAQLIAEALSVLERHPLIGRPVEHGFYELVISRGRSGYVVLYDHRPVNDRILVHRIRHQREAGFED
jgi:addiction module RelE/StbE family toxin